MAKYYGNDEPLKFKDISDFRYVSGTSDWKDWINQANALEPSIEYLINKGNRTAKSQIDLVYVSSSDSDEEEIEYPDELKSGNYAFCKRIEAQVYILN